MPHGLFALPNTVLKTSPGTAVFGQDMLFDVTYLADWTKIGECREKKTDNNTKQENSAHVDWEDQAGDKTVSSTRPKANMKVIHGPSHQFIQMEP